MDSLFAAEEGKLSTVIDAVPMTNVLKILEEHSEEEEEEEQSVHDAPVISSYNDKIRPLVELTSPLPLPHSIPKKKHAHIFLEQKKKKKRKMCSLIANTEEKFSTVIDTAPVTNVLQISEEHREKAEESFHDAPIVSSYNDKIRPLLDTVDKLRHLKIMQEGIQLPTIVVVGDQSSGKSSVLESLAGISLPRGQGICTRVPLIMRLQNNLNPEPELFLEYNEKHVPTDEDKIADDISVATEEIAGKGKGISDIVRLD